MRSTVANLQEKVNSHGVELEKKKREYVRPNRQMTPKQENRPIFGCSSSSMAGLSPAPISKNEAKSLQTLDMVVAENHLVGIAGLLPATDSSRRFARFNLDARTGLNFANTPNKRQSEIGVVTK